MMSKRLLTIASFISLKSNVADIGSDHGYLLIYLKSIGHCGKLLGVENKKGPYDILKSNIAKSLYQDIILSFSDGISMLDDSYDTIVIAGLGYDIIKSIILKDQQKLDNIKTIIIDSHTKTEHVRRFFSNIGYKIDKEEILKEKNTYYEIIRFVKGEKGYNQLDFCYGPILRKANSKVFKEKYLLLISKLELVLSQIDKQNKKYFVIKKKINEIRKVL